MALRIAIGGDHAGYELKAALIRNLRDKGLEVRDFGGFTKESMDYPDPAHGVADCVATGGAEIGLLICGSGNGVNIVANKHKGVRAALAWTAEIAALARQHNDANVLSLPARYITESEAQGIVEAFLGASFEGGRHQRRVEKIENAH